MAGPGTVDSAGRAIAGLLGYNPGPGIYSRLERAVQAMPEQVRVQELPGLIKRYKDGVPGWELKETDLDSVIAGRDVVPREELLARVRERSPAYTHKEVVLGGSPPTRPAAPDGSEGDYDVPVAVRQGRASRLGEGVSHGSPKYEEYGHGGQDYTEILVRQPGATGTPYGNHWSNVDGGDRAVNSTVAHARFDTHGDALRINELQSDLGIHNRKVREAAANYKSPPEQLPGESNAAYLDRSQEQGYVMQRGDDGRWIWANDPKQQGIPFPLEDAWSDLLIKRLALEAAQKGHRAIEVASPRAIADKVGGDIDNYEHFYGKVVPGALERLGRKMGGLVDDTDPAAISAARRATGDVDAYERIDRIAELAQVPGLENRSSAVASHANRRLGDLGQALWWQNRPGGPPQGISEIQTMQKNMAEILSEIVGPERMNEMYLRAQEIAAAHAAHRHALNQVIGTPFPTQINPAGRRYLMSDEMRRRIIQEGIPAAVAIGVGADQMIDRLGQQRR